MKNHSLIALISLLLALVLCGCGSKEPVETTAAVPPAQTMAPDAPLELTSWSMNATAWSSPNGATVNITAVPNGFAEGQYAMFTVRLEGEEIASVPCSWNGSVYTASADLNAADGYCYFITLTSADGTHTEVAVNTPSAIFDESLVNMATALNAYCEADISEFQTKGDQVTIAQGNLKLQLPRLTLDTAAVTCQSATLALRYQDRDVASQSLTVPQADDKGICAMDLSGVSFSIPKSVEDDHQLTVRLDVVLSNGQTLTAPAGTWYYLDGQLLLAVG